MKQLYTAPFEWMWKTWKKSAITTSSKRSVLKLWIYFILYGNVDGSQTNSIGIEQIQKTDSTWQKHALEEETSLGNRQLWMSLAREEANITIGAALSHNVCFCKNLSLEVISFLDDLHNQHCQLGGTRQRARNTTFVVVWDNVAFHHSQSLTGLLHIPGCLSFSCPSWTP